MTVCGIDFSTHNLDLVLLDEDTDAATWHRYPLAGHDAFERARNVRAAMPGVSFWDDVVAAGIEEPRGYGNGALLRVQGAVLAHMPLTLLVQPLLPGEWRKTIGLSGRASKDDVWRFAHPKLIGASSWYSGPPWTQDAMDAYCIALATRTLLHRNEVAA